MTNWNTRFFSIAKTVANWSKDPSKKIGAVIVDQQNRIVSTGFNGIPRGVLETDERLNNKEIKRSITIHAEENAILFAKRDLTNCRLFIYGLPPCAHCCAMIIQSGISEVNYMVPKEYEISDFWSDNIKLGHNILKERGLCVIDFSDEQC